MIPYKGYDRLDLLSVSDMYLEPTIHPPTTGIGLQRMVLQEGHKDFRQGHVGVDLGQLTEFL